MVWNKFLYTFFSSTRKQISVFHENMEPVFLLNHNRPVLYANKIMKHARRKKIEKKMP